MSKAMNTKISHISICPTPPTLEEIAANLERVLEALAKKTPIISDETIEAINKSWAAPLRLPIKN